MSNLKQLRNRVKSVKSTQKITKAMQVVSAAKLGKVKDKAEDLNNYSFVLADLMYDVTLALNGLELTENEMKFFKQEDETKDQLMLVMTSERGLCGSFNSQIIKSVKRDIEDLKSRNINVRIIVVGKKGYDGLKAQYAELIDEYYNIHKENSLPITLQLVDKIVNLVQEEKIGSCYLYYNEFKNPLSQVMTKMRILPVDHETNTNDRSAYEYEGLGLVDILVNLYITGLIKYGFLQNQASEEAARMTAMDNATRNAGELINSLTLELNRSRQAMITTELTEIISGAEAI